MNQVLPPMASASLLGFLVMTTCGPAGAGAGVGAG